MSNQLAVRPTSVITTFDDVTNVASAMAKSGYFQDSREAAQAVVKILAGQELGLGPFASMTGIFIIQGRPSLGANIIATLIKNDPRYDYRVAEMTDEKCSIRFFEGGTAIGVSEFTKEDAKRAGTKNMDKFPRNMLFARAISNGARWFTPGIFGGAPVYTPEELGADIDEDGNVIAGTAHEINPDPEPEPEPVTASTNGDRPYHPQEVRKKIRQAAEKFNDFTPTEKQQQLLRYGLELCFAGDENAADKRHAVLHYLTGKASTKEVSGQYFKALIEKWLDLEKSADGSGDYVVNPYAAKEAQSIVTEALKEEGQQTLL